MASSLSLNPLAPIPSELLLSISFYAALNGDLTSLRSVNSALNILIIKNSKAILQQLCSHYQISLRLLEAYTAANEVEEDDVKALALLSHEIARLRILYEDGQRFSVEQKEPAQWSLKSLLWSSILSASLQKGADFTKSLQDVLAPSPTNNVAVPVALVRSFKAWLKDDISLEELEQIITAINIAVSKLWSTVFLYQDEKTSVNTFGGLSGHTFNIEQAVLTEMVIWRGPVWAAKVLSKPGTRGGDSSEVCAPQVDRWRGSVEDGARIAANGLARLLWKNRQHKIDEEREAQAQKISAQSIIITSLPVNVAVWRGSSGGI